MTYHVGARQLTLNHNQQASPMLVLYPSQTPSEMLQLGPFSVRAGRGAAPAPGRFPVVLISHGSGGNHLGYLGIARHLAAHGFVAAMPEHPGNSRNDNSLDGTLDNLQNRPRHLSLALDTLAADPVLATVVSSTAAVYGHSMGGYTGLAAAGGSPWFKPGVPVEVHRDDRIKALVLAAPATPWFTPDGSLADVDVPILMFTGEHDPFTPAFHADLVTKQITAPGQVTHERVANAGHFSFLSPFPPAMCSPQFPPSTDPPGFDRQQFHETLHQRMVDFLRSVPALTE